MRRVADALGPTGRSHGSGVRARRGRGQDGLGVPRDPAVRWL